MTYYEEHEGNTVQYPRPATLGILSIIGTSLGASSEGGDRPNYFAGAGAIFGYLIMCAGVNRTTYVLDAEMFHRDKEKDALRNAGKRNVYIGKPETREEIDGKARIFHAEQARLDKTWSLVAAAISLGNGITSRNDANKYVGFGVAAFNVLYYLFDPNHSRQKAKFGLDVTQTNDDPATRWSYVVTLGVTF